MGQLLLQGQDQVFGKHGDTVLAALAVTHHDLASFKAEVLYAQAQALQHPHAGPVQQRRQQPHRPTQFVQKRTHLRGSEDHRKASLRLGGSYFIQPGQVQLQHFAIHEQQG